MQLPSDRRFHFAAWPVAVAVAALLVGFALGDFVIGPAVTDDELAEEAAARRAERFTSRSIDLTRHFPDPPTYRTPTPDFPDHGPSNHAAAARERALNAVASTGAAARPGAPPGPAPLVPPDGMNAFAAGNADDRTFGQAPAGQYDRHSNSHYY